MRIKSWQILGMAWIGMATLASQERESSEGRKEPPPDGEKETKSVEEQLEALDQELRILRRKFELDREAQDAKVKEAPRFSIGKEGLSFKSADGAFVLKVRGYLHADSRWFVDEGDPRLADQFLIRRARPFVEGTFFKIFDFRIMPDFGGGTASLQDGYLDARFLESLKLRAGKFKEPFGIERLQSATDIRFVERALPTNLVPNRDVGAQLHGDLFSGALNYAVGLFNGVADGGSTDGDTHDGKDVAARLFALPFKSAEPTLLSGLGIGVAGTLGDQEGTLPTYRSTGQVSIFTYRSTVVGDGAHYRVSPQAHYYVGPFMLLLEYVLSGQRVELGAESETIQNQAWQVAAGWVLTGEDNSYKSVTPRNAFDPRNGGWGAFELVARLSWLQIDGDAFPVFANESTAVKSALAWGAGVNWYLNHNVKFVVDFERTTFEGGATGGGDRDEENVIFTRVQFNF